MGERFVLPDIAVWVFVACFYINGMRRTVLAFRNATGIFWYDRYRAILEAVVNLIISIPLTYLWGVMGVKLGSLIALLLTTFWLEGYVLYKHFFEKSSIMYQLLQIKYCVLTVLLCLLTTYLCKLVDTGSVSSFILECAICVVVPNVIMLLLSARSKEFQYFWGIVVRFLKKKKQGKR